jgi:hypothetical protein
MHVLSGKRFVVSVFITQLTKKTLSVCHGYISLVHKFWKAGKEMCASTFYVARCMQTFKKGVDNALHTLATRRPLLKQFFKACIETAGNTFFVSVLKHLTNANVCKILQKL